MSENYEVMVRYYLIQNICSLTTSAKNLTSNHLDLIQTPFHCLPLFLYLVEHINVDTPHFLSSYVPLSRVYHFIYLCPKSQKCTPKYAKLFVFIWHG